MDKQNAFTFKYILKSLNNGIIKQNPSFVQLIGLCPLLATTTNVINAFFMGLATLFVLAFSNFLISILRKLIPNQVRIAVFIVIISGLVVTIEMIMKAFLPEINDALGVFVSLIAVNCLIFSRAEAFASKNKPLPSLLDGISVGLGVIFSFVIIGFFREILGSGTVCGIPIFGENFKPVLVFVMPAGAFFALGFIIAFVQKLRVLPIEIEAKKYGVNFRGTRG